MSGKYLFRAVALLACLAAAACAEGAGSGDDGDDVGDLPPGDDAAPPDAVPSETVCTGGADDDGDGDVDCDDADCAAAPECQPEPICNDAVDNEGDGPADCLDRDCDGRDGCEHGVELSCADAADNDGDGDEDCADADCGGQGDCEHPAELSCTDGKDNDGDDLADCADPDCAGAPTCVPETACSDGLDNDVDGTTDCADFDCDGMAGCEFGTELSCADGKDNDAGGGTDCADVDCDGVGSCEHGAEASCGDAIDNDADGMTDCADADCGLVAACVAQCPAGSTAESVSGAGLPLTIPDPGTRDVTVSLAGTGIVTKALVRLSIDHGFAGDLDISLLAPGGAPAIDLSSDNGGGGDDYTSTLFSDGAATAITAGSPPFTGSFRPEQPLAGVAGRGKAGTWTLRVADDTASDAGSVTAWTLYVCTCFGTPGCEFGAACLDGIDSDGDMQIDCADSDCATVAQCIPEAACGDTLDNDLDGKVDCLDADCNGNSGCEFGAEVTCNDAADNDADGLVDCADPSCAMAVACLPESNCHDGVDNNGNGTTDCNDPLCAGVAGCELGGEESCSDGIDNDSDGAVDCAEADCVFACSLAACAAGEIMVGGRATDVPAAIPDPGTRSSTIAIGRGGTVTRVAVRLSITHGYAEDLDVNLVSPGATSRNLTSDNGAAGDNYTSTVFIDSAATAITAGSPPFTGSFRPEQALSAYAGQSVSGAWRLDAIDDDALIAGTLQSWELAICVTP